MPDPANYGNERYKVQYEEVRLAAMEEHIVLVQSPELLPNLSSPAAVYEKDHVFIRDVDRDTVWPSRLDAVPVPERSVPGVGLYRTQGETADQALSRVNTLDEFVGNPVLFRNHLAGICPVQMCPGDEPVPPPPVTAVADPFPGVRSSGGSGVTVQLLDTGMVDGFKIGHSWLTGVPDTQNRDRPSTAGAIRPYEGHGTFTTGVLMCAAPEVTVHTANIFRFAGATMEDSLVRALNVALDQRPDMIVLPAGVWTVPDTVPVGLEPFYARLNEDGCDTLLVAAAGNNGNTIPFYPAAFAPGGDAVVSVGASRYDGQGRACFSNYGDWVKVFALGERHVNAFMHGLYTYIDPQRVDLTCRYYEHNRLYCPCTCVTRAPQGSTVSFHGMARWSGTSFATPLVAGLIATHMSDTGKSPREAAKDVIGGSKAIVDNDGVTLQVLGHGL